MDEVTDTSYQYPDFLDQDDEFIEFKSYLVGESVKTESSIRTYIFHIRKYD